MREHREFFEVDTENDWETIPGYPSGFQRMTLSSDIDESAETGKRTRLVKVDPGTVMGKAVVHDHWEEVFIYQGDLVVGCDEHGDGGITYNAPTYAVRPGGILHGPFASTNGCLMIEMHYFDVCPSTNTSRSEKII
ncbi:MAG: cupin domain-containing protein [Stappiaceae bacterium]